MSKIEYIFHPSVKFSENSEILSNNSVVTNINKFFVLFNMLFVKSTLQGLKKGKKWWHKGWVHVTVKYGPYNIILDYPKFLHASLLFETANIL